VIELFPPHLAIYHTFQHNRRGLPWLDRLPELVERSRSRWGLALGEPYTGGSCSWVAPVTRDDGSPAVLKITWPHREARSEAEGLRRFAGRGAAELYAENADDYALLVERIEPAVKLEDAHHIPAERRLLAGAELLRELWAAPLPASGEPTTVETLAAIMEWWADEAQERTDRLDHGYDPGVVALGIDVLRHYAASADRQVLLHGDFNPTNILSATREPWLSIDVKPMVGDPCFDPFPLVEQIDDPFLAGDARLVKRRFQMVADELGLDVTRMLTWAIGRKTEYGMTAADEGWDGGPRHMADARMLAALAGL
jgi:streptomycin 6-kinase